MWQWINPKQWNIWIRRFFFVMLMLISITSSLAIWLSEFLSQQLSGLIFIQSNGLYSVTFSDIDVNPFTLHASVDDLTIEHHYQKEKYKDTKVFVSGSVKEVELNDIGLYRMIAYEELYIGNLSIIEPDITLSLNREFVPQQKPARKKIPISFEWAKLVKGKFKFIDRDSNKIEAAINDLSYFEKNKIISIRKPLMKLTRPDGTGTFASIQKLDIQGTSLNELLMTKNFSMKKWESDGLTAIVNIPQNRPKKKSEVRITKFDTFLDQLRGADFSMKNNSILINDASEHFRINGGEIAIHDSVIHLNKWKFLNYNDTTEIHQRNIAEIPHLSAKFGAYVRDSSKRKAVFASITLDHPSLSITLQNRKEDLQKIDTLKEIREKTEPLVIPDLSVFLDSIQINDAAVRIRNSAFSLQLNGLHIRRIKADSLERGILMHTGNSVRLFMHTMVLKTNKGFKCKLKNIQLNTIDGTIAVDSLTLNNRKAKKPFNPMLVKLNQIELRGIKLSENGIFNLDSLLIGDGYTQLEKRFHPPKKPFHLADKMPFHIQYIQGKNLRLDFIRNMRLEAEKNGKFNITGIAFEGHHFSNRSENIRHLNNTASFRMNLRGSTTKGEFRCNLADPHFGHSLHLYTYGLNLTRFNNELISIAGVEAKTGRIPSMEITISGNADKVKASAKIRYDQLELIIHKRKKDISGVSHTEEGEYNHFLTKIANHLLKNSNMQMADLPAVNIEMKSDPNKRIINTWIRSMVMCTLQTIVPSNQKIFDLKQKLEIRKEERKKRKDERKKRKEDRKKITDNIKGK
jgi:hypothetical protein